MRPEYSISKVLVSLLTACFLSACGKEPATPVTDKAAIEIDSAPAPHVEQVQKPADPFTDNAATEISERDRKFIDEALLDIKKLGPGNSPGKADICHSLQLMNVSNVPPNLKTICIAAFIEKAQIEKLKKHPELVEVYAESARTFGATEQDIKEISKPSAKAAETLAAERKAATNVSYEAAVRHNMDQLGDVMMDVAKICPNPNGSDLDCKNAMARVGTRAQQGLNDMGKRSAPTCLSDVASAFKAAMKSYVLGSRISVRGFADQDTNTIFAGLRTLQEGDASIKTLKSALASATCH